MRTAIQVGTTDGPEREGVHIREGVGRDGSPEQSSDTQQPGCCYPLFFFRWLGCQLLGLMELRTGGSGRRCGTTRACNPAQEGSGSGSIMGKYSLRRGTNNAKFWNRGGGG